MSRVSIVGALNVTPDSFHDGGKYLSAESALECAAQMVADGADIIEIGGESTGPKSPDVSIDQELERVIPVIRVIRKKYPDATLSIDTYKSSVAQAAIQEGVAMVNDVTAGRADPQMFPMLASAGVRVVLMYAKDPSPRTTIDERQYDDVVADIKTFLEQRVSAALSAGIKRENIILDPGMGHFISSDPRYSLEVLARLPELATLGYPLFISPSRKSFLAGTENLKTADRLPGTIAASAIAVLSGARFIRTHDVKEVRRGCEIAERARSFLAS